MPNKFFSFRRCSGRISPNSRNELQHVFGKVRKRAANLKTFLPVRDDVDVFRCWSIWGIIFNCIMFSIFIFSFCHVFLLVVYTIYLLYFAHHVIDFAYYIYCIVSLFFAPEQCFCFGLKWNAYVSKYFLCLNSFYGIISMDSDIELLTAVPHWKHWKHISSDYSS